jgi:hypothetical protein
MLFPESEEPKSRSGSLYGKIWDKMLDDERGRTGNRNKEHRYTQLYSLD